MKSTIQSKVLSYRIRCILGLLVITSFAYQVYNNKPGIIDRFVFADTVLAEDSTRAASPERYIYQVTPDDFTCGTTSPTQGIIKLRLQPNNSNHTLHGEIRKCDAGKFSKDGSAYISIHEGQQFGPYPYKSGDDVVRFTIDPVAQGIYGSNSYQAQVFPHDQNYPILSGFVEAEAYFSTTVTAQKNNSIWQDVGIWYSTTSGQPGGNGFYENFLPEGIGNWNFYVEKKTGYTITANYTYSEQPNYYRFNIPTGAQVTASFVPTTKPSAALDSNEQTAPCQWAIWIKLTGFTPNSQLIIRSDYSELACESGEFVTNSWTTTYGLSLIHI